MERVGGACAAAGAVKNDRGRGVRGKQTTAGGEESVREVRWRVNESGDSTCSSSLVVLLLHFPCVDR